eukprot:CAMPEP_0202709576 /NCGR_PEP_ID=MMETSP1385-20130828/21673_1 /ASSEMBLY_ACC=CAM_ASM_000861 /TAXON_ID=933848 /ORGANISM="Elphidium margaritaceum" /LENGTH=563 /DNA_ID=CAMNT_0049368871 /DNA_START=25 /DNA_END=1716 /DNA_ORIENTATION=+
MSNPKLIMGVPSTMNDAYQLNLRKLVERGARIQPNNEIVTKIDGGYHRTTHKQLQARATKMASALHKLGVQVGDRVATLMWNNVRHLMLYYAVPSMGCVLHAVNWRLHPTEIQYLIEHAQDRVLFVDVDLLPILQELPPSTLTRVQKIIVCGENMQSNGYLSQTLPSPQYVDYEVFESTGDSFFAWPELDERSAMALCYTSGTTGRPKGVAYSHRSTYLHTLTMMTSDCQSLRGYDCVLPITPMFHVLGWGYPFVAFTMGLKVLLAHNAKDYTQVLDMCAQEECNLVAGVPTVMQAFRGPLQASPQKYAKLKGVLTRSVCGGSAPPTELIEWYYKEWGIELIQAWGMTETNPLGSVARRLERLKGNQRTCGIALPLVEMKIVDPQRLDVELERDGEKVGELLVKGPWVTKEYFSAPETKDKFIDGWLKTGDLATITPQQQMIIKDRSKDMIKSGGEWISSVDMEGFIMALPAVDMAVVVAAKHPKWMERPVAICKLKEGHTLSKQEVVDHLKARFSKFQIPDDVLFWKEIPLTGTGKMSKKLVREKLNKMQYVLPSLRTQSKL